MNEPQTQIEENGFLIDAETGEVVGLAGVKEDFTVTDEKSADWVLEKLMDSETQVARLNIKLKALTENIQTQIKAEERKQNFLKFKFGPALEHFARVALEGKKTKTLPLTFGKLSLRTVKGGLRVADAQKALEWAKNFFPGAIKVTETFQISLVPDGVKGEIDLALTDETAFAEGQPGHQEGWREIAKEAFEIKPDEEKFDIKTGVSA
jgi:hypothetical protein